MLNYSPGFVYRQDGTNELSAFLRACSNLGLLHSRQMRLLLYQVNF